MSKFDKDITQYKWTWWLTMWTPLDRLDFPSIFLKKKSFKPKDTQILSQTVILWNTKINIHNKIERFHSSFLLSRNYQLILFNIYERKTVQIISLVIILIIFIIFLSMNSECFSLCPRFFAAKKSIINYSQFIGIFFLIIIISSDIFRKCFEYVFLRNWYSTEINFYSQWKAIVM